MNFNPSKHFFSNFSRKPATYQNNTELIESIIGYKNEFMAQCVLIGKPMKSNPPIGILESIELDKENEDLVEKFTEVMNPYLTVNEMKSMPKLFGDFYNELCKMHKPSTAEVFNIKKETRTVTLLRIDNCDWLTFVNQNLGTILRLILNDNTNLWEAIKRREQSDQPLNKVNTLVVVNVFNECQFISEDEMNHLKVIFKSNGTNFIMRACDFTLLEMLASKVNELRMCLINHIKLTGFKCIMHKPTELIINNLVLQRVHVDGFFFDGTNWIKSMNSLRQEITIKVENEIPELATKYSGVSTVQVSILKSDVQAIKKVRMSQIKPWSDMEQSWALSLTHLGRSLGLDPMIVDSVINTAHKLELGAVPLLTFLEYFSCVICTNFCGIQNHFVNLMSINQRVELRCQYGLIGYADDVRLHSNEKSFLMAVALRAFHDWDGKPPVSPIFPGSFKFQWTQIEFIINQFEIKYGQLKENEFININILKCLVDKYDNADLNVNDQVNE